MIPRKNPPQVEILDALNFLLDEVTEIFSFIIFTL